MTNPTDRTGDDATIAARLVFCRAIAIFYVSRCEMSVAWADLYIANLEFLISCHAVHFSCMGRGMSCPGKGMSCHADRELMMVGALTRCSWMAGERSDDTKGAMAGSEGSGGVRQGEEVGRCGHEERDKSNCWCLLLSLRGDCACRL